VENILQSYPPRSLKPLINDRLGHYTIWKSISAEASRMVDALACRPRCACDREEDRYATILAYGRESCQPRNNYEKNHQVCRDRGNRVITRNHVAACVRGPSARSCVYDLSFFFYSLLSEMTTVREVEPYKVTSKAGSTPPSPITPLALDRASDRENNVILNIGVARWKQGRLTRL